MPQNNSSNGNLVQLEHLKKYFPVRSGVMQRVVANVLAVDDVSFTIKRGETLGLVGESGCGKTTVGRTMLRLIEPTGGSAFYNGVDIFKLKSRELKSIRRDMRYPDTSAGVCGSANRDLMALANSGETRSSASIWNTHS